MATGCQDPYIREGIVDFSGCVSLRSSNPQVISQCASKKWKSWSLDIENACLRADGFTRDAFLQAPVAWELSRSERAWRLKAPAYGLNDVPVAFHRSLRGHLLDLEASAKRAGLRRQASRFDPSLFSISREDGSAADVCTIHIDDILGYGEPDVLPRIRDFSEQRFGKSKLHEFSFVFVGMDLAQEGDFSATFTTDEFAQNLKPHSYNSAIFGSSAENVFIKGYKIASMQAWRIMLSRDGLETRYMYTVGPHCVSGEFTSGHRFVSN